MTSKRDVIAMHREHPDWNSGDIARALGCSRGYVVATFRRNGLQFPISRARVSATRAKERERSARIAERFGDARIAEAIRDGAPRINLPEDETPC